MKSIAIVRGGTVGVGLTAGVGVGLAAPGMTVCGDGGVGLAPPAGVTDGVGVGLDPAAGAASHSPVFGFLFSSLVVAVLVFES